MIPVPGACFALVRDHACRVVHDKPYHTELPLHPAGAAVIVGMPERPSSVFVLVNVEGHSYKEAAAILGIPIGTVMPRLSAARLKLAAMVAGDMERRA